MSGKGEILALQFDPGVLFTLEVENGDLRPIASSMGDLVFKGFNSSGRVYFSNNQETFVLDLFTKEILLSQSPPESQEFVKNQSLQDDEGFISLGAGENSIRLDGSQYSAFGFLGQDNFLTTSQQGVIEYYDRSTQKKYQLTGLSTGVRAIYYTADLIGAQDNRGILYFWTRDNIIQSDSTPAELMFQWTDKVNWTLWNSTGHYGTSSTASAFLSVFSPSKPGLINKAWEVSSFSKLLNKDPEILASCVFQNRKEIAVTQPLSKKTINEINVDYNFYLHDLPKGWSAYPAFKEINPSVTSSFMNTGRNQFFAIVSEKIANPLVIGSIEEYTEFTLVAIQNKALQEFKTLSKESIIINGRRAMYFEFSLKISNLSYLYTNLVVEKAGIYHRLMCWTPASSNRKKFIDESMEVFKCFEILPKVMEPAEYKKTNSTAMGFSINYHDSDLMPWPEASEQYYGALEGAFYNSSALFYVIPLYIAEDFDPSIKALMTAFLAVQDIDVNDLDLKNYTRLQKSDSQGIQFSYNDNFFHQIQILRHGSFAYFLAIVSKSEGNLNPEESAGIFDHIEFVKQKESPYRSLSVQEKNIQADIINQTGLYYYRQNQYDIAGSYFKSAFETNKEESVFLTNYLLCLAAIEEYHPLCQDSCH